MLPAGFALTPGGHEQQTPGARTWTERTEANVVTQKVINGEKTQDIAQPGDLWIETRDALTVGESAAADTVIADHVSTNRSADQVEVDIDAADVADLLPDWSTYDAQTPERQAVMVSKAIRLILRRFDAL